MTFLEYLRTCPQLQDMTVNTVSPDGTGIFPQGIRTVETDITGSGFVEKAYILRHRDRPESCWAETVSSWLLQNPGPVPVTPVGGKLTAPTAQGFGTFELEIRTTEYFNGGNYEN